MKVFFFFFLIENNKYIKTMNDATFLSMSSYFFSICTLLFFPCVEIFLFFRLGICKIISFINTYIYTRIM